MSITHIVLFKFKSSTTDAEIQSCFIKLAKLTRVLPIIRSFEWGPYSSNEGLNQGFTHAFIMTFDHADDRDAYLVHPEHVKVAEFIQRYIDFPSGVIAFDARFMPHF